jgi:3-hydroxy-3-methylglutaryl CoA synthase
MSTLFDIDLRYSNFSYSEIFSSNELQGFDPITSDIFKYRSLDEKAKKTAFERYWSQKAAATLYLSANLGNIYTGSLYACLISLICDDKIYLEV